MRTIKLVFAVGSLSLAACGDDTAVPADARVDMADAPADGRTFAGYEANEGGEVRAEYIIFSNGGIATRTTAFFFKDSGPTKFFEYLDQNGCTDMRMDTKWPQALNPIGERVYYDVGPYVAITGGPNPLAVKKNPAMGNDPFGRTHPANGWYFEGAAPTMPDTTANKVCGSNATNAGAVCNSAADCVVTSGTATCALPTVPNTEGPMFETEKTLYDVTLPGSSEFPGAHFADVMYMPAAFTLNTCSPTACPAGGAGVAGLSPTAMSFPDNTAQTFTWTTPADSPPAGTTVLSLVGFTGANGPAVLCVEPNDGSITVPAAMMNAALTEYPTGGTMSRQTLTHTVRELVDANGPTGKRVDFVAVWCYASQPFIKTP